VSLELRPTFTIDVDESCDRVVKRLQIRLAATELFTRWARVPGARTDDNCSGTFVWIAPPTNKQRFWSPWLQLSVLPLGDKTQLFGRFSPKPAVWTAFALSYLFLACVMFFGCMLGLAQVMVKTHAWGFWTTAGAAVLTMILWWISQTGKRLADEQMRAIRAHLESALTRGPSLASVLKSDGKIGTICIPDPLDPATPS
jgi:hypothetical protein